MKMILLAIILVFSLPTSAEKPKLTIYVVKQVKKIWNDAGLNTNKHVSIWRAQTDEDGYCSLGDMVVTTSQKPKIGLLVKLGNEGDVHEPLDYESIWSSWAKGAKREVELWKVICPEGYVSLGNVATSGSRPKKGDVCCVKQSYTNRGSRFDWEPVWQYNPESWDGVSIYQAQTSEYEKEVSVGGFEAAQTYGRRRPYSSAYFLKRDDLSIAHLQG